MVDSDTATEQLYSNGATMNVIGNADVIIALLVFIFALVFVVGFFVGRNTKSNKSSFIRE